MTQPPAPQDPIIPNCLMVRLRWGTTTRVFRNVLHAQYTLAGPINPGLAETLFTAFKSSFAGSTANSLIHTSVSFQGVDVKDLRAANNPFVESTSAPVPGTGAAGLISLATAIVITERTQFSGRQFRGRVYFGGLDADALADQTHCTPAASGILGAFLNGMQTAMSQNALTLAIGQKHLPQRENKKGTKTFPERPANVIPVTQLVVVDNRLDTQRRRLGRN